MIETLADVVEFLADQADVYGAHDEDCETIPCRVCWTQDVTARIRAAVKIEQQLERGARPLNSRDTETGK